MRKEKTLKGIINTAVKTGLGEYKELIFSHKSFEEITKENLYEIYDLKTAYYTFACPLASGAMLAGADKEFIKKLYNYGVYIGRAFQIKNDVKDIWGGDERIYKSMYDDIKKSRKTILVWHAYLNTEEKNKKYIKELFSKKNISKQDCMRIRGILNDSNTLKFAEKEIQKLKHRAYQEIEDIEFGSREVIRDYCDEMVSL
jgi:geranylgeranyl pyrophosphate synthase